MKDTTFFEKHINNLSNLLAVGEDFPETYEYFFDHLGENFEFIKLGKRYNNPDMKKILHGIGECVLNEKVMVTGLVVTQIPQYRFFHGGCRLNGQMTAFFLFKGFNMGMVALSHKEKAIGTLFIRFTFFEAPNKHLSLQNVSRNSHINTSGFGLH